MDNTLYRSLTQAERSSHIDITRPISILPSGEANYADMSQIAFIPSGNTAMNNVLSPISIVAPSGLEFLQNDKLSNAKQSKDNAVSGINIFNPYIHYLPNENMPFKIDFSTQFNEVAKKFNIYSKQYRDQFQEDTVEEEDSTGTEGET